MFKNRDPRKWLYIGAVAALLIVFMLWLYLQADNRQKAVLNASDTEASDADEDSGAPADIYVHITGAVENPGVLKLPGGARLIDAIEKLGGLTEDADTDSVNLAAVLKDEDKIHIYTREEVTLNETGPSGIAGKVNINTAGLEELKTLPGVGDAIGKGIITYREKNGGFRALEELKEVDRIGDKVYDKLKDAIIL